MKCEEWTKSRFPIPEEIEWHEDGADVPTWALVGGITLMVLVVLGAFGLIVLQPV